MVFHDSSAIHRSMMNCEPRLTPRIFLSLGSHLSVSCSPLALAATGCHQHVALHQDIRLLTSGLWGPGTDCTKEEIEQ